MHARSLRVDPTVRLRRLRRRAGSGERLLLEVRPSKVFLALSQLTRISSSSDLSEAVPPQPFRNTTDLPLLPSFTAVPERVSYVTASSSPSPFSSGSDSNLPLILGLVLGLGGGLLATCLALFWLYKRQRQRRGAPEYVDGGPVREEAEGPSADEGKEEPLEVPVIVHTMATVGSTEEPQPARQRAFDCVSCVGQVVRKLTGCSSLQSLHSLRYTLPHPVPRTRTVTRRHTIALRLACPVTLRRSTALRLLQATASIRLAIFRRTQRSRTLPTSSHGFERCKRASRSRFV